MLFVTKLHEGARLPTCSHPGSDLGFDVYALEDVDVDPHSVTKVHTGMSAQYAPFGDNPDWRGTERYGLIVKDRSSMAAAGLFTVGGVIDSSYTGEIMIMFRNVSQAIIGINAGEKIAQLVPVKVHTAGRVKEVDTLPYSERGAKGFGSTGK